MANEEHIQLLREGAESWNKKREENPVIPDEIFTPDFSKARLVTHFWGSSDLEGANLKNGDFREALVGPLNLKKANLQEAQFQKAFLMGIDLGEAELGNADFSEANLHSADLRGVRAEGTSFAGTDLSNADLRGGRFARADFTNANLAGANIEGADLSQALLAGIMDITNTYPWKSVLFATTNLFPARKDGEPEILGLKRTRGKIKSVADLVKKCRIFKNHYKASEGDFFFNEYCLFYFRGENRSSWELRPSVMRDSPEGKTNFFRERESEMLLKLMSRMPEDFAGVNSAISQWVIAQHHGLTTRFLDVTRNPLVALFHACEEGDSSDRSRQDDGVLHFFAVPRRLVKAFDSDAISVVANLAKLPLSEQEMLMGWLEHEEFDSLKEPERPTDYPIIMDRLYHHIRSEKPHFKQRIDIRDFFRVFVVEPKQMFERIRVQSGAFLVSAFHKRFETDQILKLNKNTPVYHHYKLAVPAGEKKNILEELELLNVKREILFPGLDEAAAAVVKGYEYDE